MPTIITECCSIWLLVFKDLLQTTEKKVEGGDSGGGGVGESCNNAAGSFQSNRIGWVVAEKSLLWKILSWETVPERIWQNYQFSMICIPPNEACWVEICNEVFFIYTSSLSFSPSLAQLRAEHLKKKPFYVGELFFYQ